MRGLTIFIVMCCLHLTMDGQSITDVRYWFDQNDSESITESTAGNPWQDAIDVSALSEGWHFVHFTFKDNLGQWSAVASNRFRKLNANPNDLASVTYWFNMDDSSPINAPISGTGWNSSIDVSALPLGWHFINFYFHDIRGQKSSASRARFRKMDASQTLITTAELWFDTADSSPAQAAAIGEDITFDNDFSTAGLEPGWHDVHVRFHDNKGRASSVITSKARVNDGAINNILLAKFWFDDCDALDQFVYEYQSPDTEITFFTCTCLAPCDATVGDHQMHVQFQDTRGVWSSVLTETLFFNDTPCTTDCRADINDDGIVDVLDFIELNAVFGTSCTDCPEDINDDGDVDILDFIVLNSSFGKICDFGSGNNPPIAPPSDDLKGTLEVRPDIEVNEEIQKVLDSTASAQMNVYPNPVQTDELYVRLSGVENTPVTEVEIMDALGRIVYRQAYTLNGTEALLRLDLPADIADGSYLVRLLLADGQLSTVIVVE